MKALQTLGQQRTALETYLAFGERDVDPHKFMWLVNWRDYNLPFCTVYIVAPDNGWPCKIGVSVHPERRVKDLQTSVWKPLAVAHSFCCASTKSARSLEAKAHETLTEMNRWLHGEWFDMRPDEAADIVRFAATVIGVECSEKIEDTEVLADIVAFVQDSRVDNARQARQSDMKKQSRRAA